MNFCEDVRSHRQLWVDSHIPSVGILIHAASKGSNDAKKKKIFGEQKEEKSRVRSFQRQATAGRIASEDTFHRKFCFLGLPSITIADRLPVFVDAYCSLLGVRVNKTTSLTQFQN